jgi:hypothetical protein
LSDFENCDYVLVSIAKEHESPAGFTMTSRLIISYKLLEKENNELIWEKTISSSLSKNVSDALNGNKRRKLLIEDTIKDNTMQLLNELAEIELLREERDEKN